jgi:hypothetical protein
MMHEFIVITCLAFWICVILFIIWALQNKEDPLDDVKTRFWREVDSVSDQCIRTSDSHYALLRYLKLKEVVVPQNHIFIERNDDIFTEPLHKDATDD